MINYPYLPSGRKILYVSETNPFMMRAKEICINESTDMSVPAGSVVVLNSKIIGEAANKAQLNNPLSIKLHSKFCLRRIFGIKTGQKYWVCPGCAKPRNHSESSAIRDVHKKGYDPNGADLYLYGHWWCCKSCWDSMIEGGIKDVYLLEGSDILFNKTHRSKSHSSDSEK